MYACIYVYIYIYIFDHDTIDILGVKLIANLFFKEWCAQLANSVNLANDEIAYGREFMIILTSRWGPSNPSCKWRSQIVGFYFSWFVLLPYIENHGDDEISFFCRWENTICVEISNTIAMFLNTNGGFELLWLMFAREYIQYPISLFFFPFLSFLGKVWYWSCFDPAGWKTCYCAAIPRFPYSLH